MSGHQILRQPTLHLLLLLLLLVGLRAPLRRLHLLLLLLGLSRGLARVRLHLGLGSHDGRLLLAVATGHVVARRRRLLLGRVHDSARIVAAFGRGRHGYLWPSADKRGLLSVGQKGIVSSQGRRQRRLLLLLLSGRLDGGLIRGGRPFRADRQFRLQSCRGRRWDSLASLCVCLCVQVN